MKNREQNSSGSGGGWFKSLDRLTKRGKNKVKVSKTVECLQFIPSALTWQ
jgi:hypothetical protein